MAEPGWGLEVIPCLGTKCLKGQWKQIRFRFSEGIGYILEKGRFSGLGGKGGGVGLIQRAGSGPMERMGTS